MISEVFNMDCMKYMREIPDGFFDLAVVDPPYFSGPERRDYYGRKESTIGVKRVNYGVSKAWKVPGGGLLQRAAPCKQALYCLGLQLLQVPVRPGPDCLGQMQPEVLFFRLRNSGYRPYRFRPIVPVHVERHVPRAQRQRWKDNAGEQGPQRGAHPSHPKTRCPVRVDAPEVRKARLEDSRHACWLRQQPDCRLWAWFRLLGNRDRQEIL